MFLVAAAVVAANLSGPQILGAYQGCVKQQTVRLGSANSESADTILRAVRSICKPEEQAVIDGMGTGPAMMAHVRYNAENDAIAALLEARAKRP